MLIRNLDGTLAAPLLHIPYRHTFLRGGIFESRTWRHHFVTANFDFLRSDPRRATKRNPFLRGEVMSSLCVSVMKMRYCY